MSPQFTTNSANLPPWAGNVSAIAITRSPQGWLATTEYVGRRVRVHVSPGCDQSGALRLTVLVLGWNEGVQGWRVAGKRQRAALEPVVRHTVAQAEATLRAEGWMADGERWLPPVVRRSAM